MAEDKARPKLSVVDMERNFYTKFFPAIKEAFGGDEDYVKNIIAEHGDLIKILADFRMTVGIKRPIRFLIQLYRGQNPDVDLKTQAERAEKRLEKATERVKFTKALLNGESIYDVKAKEHEEAEATEVKSEDDVDV